MQNITPKNKNFDWKTDQKRRKYAKKCLKYFKNDVKNFIEKQIDELLTRSEEKQELKKYIVHENIVNNVIKEVSLKFSQPLKVIINSEKHNAKTIKKWERQLHKLLKECDFNAVLYEIEQLVNLCFDIACLPQVRKGELKLDIITPDKAFVHNDDHDPSTAKRFFYHVKSNKASDTYHFWGVNEQNEFGKFECEIKTDGTIENIKKLNTGKLDYSCKIPVVMFRNRPSYGGFWYEGKNSLVEKNEAVNLRLTDLHKALAYNVPQLFTRGFPEDQPLIKSRSAHINVPLNELGNTQPEADYLHPNEDLKEMYEIIRDMVVTESRAYGISEAALNAANFRSGYHLALSMWRNIRKNRIERIFWRKPLEKLLQTICKTANICLDGYNFDIDNIEFSFDFQEIEFPESRQDKAKADALEKTNGVTSTARLIKKSNPDLTIDEAKTEAKNIAQEELSVLQ